MTSSTEVSRRRFAPWLGGLALLAGGASLVGVGLLQTTSSHFGASCPKGTELIAKFKYDHGHYVFDQPAGNSGVVTITSGSSKGGDASSSRSIAATVVQSSDHSVVTSYSPPQKKVHFSSAGLPQSHGKTAEITVVQFCGVVPPTPTTTTQATATTEPATTPTEPATTPTEPATTPTQPATIPVPATEASAPTSRPNDTTASTTPQSASSSTTTSVAQEAPAVTSTSILTSGSDESSLPHTGSPSVLLIALGVALMAIGMTLMIVGRARDRRANT